jgi:hypothetical protein
VKLKLANAQDLTRADHAILPADQVRTVEVDADLDAKAMHMVLPSAVADQLGLPRGGTMIVKYADQRRVEREVATHLGVTVCGRNGVFRSILEPDRTTALVGAIVMEDLDLLVDPGKQQLYPRDPAGTVYEVE